MEYKHEWTEEEMKAWHYWEMEWLKKDLQGLTLQDVPEGAELNQRYIFTPDYTKNLTGEFNMEKFKVSGQVTFLKVVHKMDSAMKAVSIERATIFSSEYVQNINSFYTCVNVKREEDADVFYSIYLTFDFEAYFDTYEEALEFSQSPELGECEVWVEYADGSDVTIVLDDYTININQEVAA